MNLNYDPKTDSLYLELRSGKYDRSKKVSGGIMADYDDKGKILGLEILGVKDIIPSFSPSKAKLNLHAKNYSV
ncbi:MAG: DUF2283 domain-containing protein [bacterium]|nr:DUF2283 domain-containing protein [bacterium]